VPYVFHVCEQNQYEGVNANAGENSQPDVHLTPIALFVEVSL
jgi:hypothetical protein